MSYQHTINVTISLDNALFRIVAGRDADGYAGRTQGMLYGRDNPVPIERQMSRWDVLQERIERLKYVDEVCFDHSNWVTLDLCTSRFDIAERRTRETIARIDRVVKRWAAGLPQRKETTP